MDKLIIKYILCIILAIVIFLPIIIIFFWSKRYKKNLFLSINEKEYLMSYPDIYILKVFLATILGYALTIISIIFDEKNSLLLAIIIFGSTTFLCSFMTIYILMWYVVVSIDSMTFYSFFRKKVLGFCEITSVIHIHDRIEPEKIKGYNGSTTLFVIEKEIIGYDLLYEQLYRAGKIEQLVVEEEIVITKIKENIGAIFFEILLSIVISICIILEADGLGIGYTIIGIFFIIIWLIDAVNNSLWRVVISSNKIQVRDKWGREKEYDIKDITKVEKKEDFAVLYVGDKKIVEVEKSLEKYVIFLEKIKSLGIEIQI